MSKMSELYNQITESIISKLETAGSWQKLWEVPRPRSINGYLYQGVNFLLLSSDRYTSPIYGTFKQIRENGGTVNRGEKATIIVFWKTIVEIDPDIKRKETKWFLKYYHVFNTEQATFDKIGQDKINSLIRSYDNPVIQSAEDVFNSLPDKPELRFDRSGRATYFRFTDTIRLPEMKYFHSSDEYYHTLFHELVHSTGIERRLGRFNLYKQFEDDAMHNYSKEELVAELGASYLAAVCGLKPNLDNAAAYIRGWSSHLKDNPSWIVWASNRAMDAANYILQLQKQEEPA